MFPIELFREPIQLQLASDISSHVEPPMAPLPCDRWLARSCLQKAIRRGEVRIAQRAFANLLAHDHRSAWRHLVIIAVEDVGVPAFDLVAGVVLTARDRKLRAQVGGDWRAGSFVVRQMAESMHCQAVCDLLLRATNDPAWDRYRAILLEASMAQLVDTLSADTDDLAYQGMAALALSGGLACGQRHHDPALLFEVLADSGYSPSLVEIARGAWRTSRNSMAILLPIVSRAWAAREESTLADDSLPDASMIAGIPEYAADQFTRVGRQVISAYVRTDPRIRAILDQASVAPDRRAMVVGDLLFLVEGTCVLNRVHWDVARRLRNPTRALTGAYMVGELLEQAQAHLAANRSAITSLRRRYLNLG